MNGVTTYIPNLKAKRIPQRVLARRVLAAALAVILAGGACAAAQVTTIQHGSQLPGGTRVVGPSQLPMSNPAPNPVFQDRRIRQLNVERQKEMVSDSEKLLKLTAELNAEIAKSHAQALTPDQLRTVAKIEKLAKSVREKMTNPVEGSIFEQGIPVPQAVPPSAMP